jgi:hypothetical protein
MAISERHSTMAAARDGGNQMLLARADAAEAGVRSESVDIAAVTRSACAEARVLLESVKSEYR